MGSSTLNTSKPWLLRPFNERSTQLFLGVLFAAVALVTLLHLVFPEGHALHVSAYTVTLLGKYLCYALLAVAVDLVWGFLGILSLGHGAFFALGGYAMGMYLMRQIGDRGVYGDPVLPDFMVFLNWQELPWFWHGFDMAWFAFAMVLLAPGLLALVFGFLAFRSRVTGVYLSIITQALTFALMLAFFRNEMGFGGNNGLTDFKDILGFDLRSDATRLALFIATGIALAIGYVVCRGIVLSKLGR
ncbi:MAG: urea ABC transporter permease subunit UrtC, partial [Marinobacter sp.]|uniref:ABC transporter permease subunit n=1 Tax=Marinobacter sp. TaxID=50741 RepID=UPI0029A67063|nr:urea ABC transporter permease subunit UrtC [Marinobacter sp.]